MTCSYLAGVDDSQRYALIGSLDVQTGRLDARSYFHGLTAWSADILADFVCFIGKGRAAHGTRCEPCNLMLFNSCHRSFANLGKLLPDL